jgi:hypothetical protein
MYKIGIINFVHVIAFFKGNYVDNMPSCVLIETR